MTTQNIHPTGVKLEPKIKLRLRKLGEMRQRSIHWLIKEAISQYLEHEEQAEKIKQETLVRWKEAEQGKIVSNASMVTWLDTWGTEHETERPQCGK